MDCSRTLTATILLTIALPGAIHGVADAPASSAATEPVVAATSATKTTYADPAPVVVHADTDRSRRLVEWALDRFGQAGLTLPATEVDFHSRYDGCHGHDGFHSTIDGIHRIDICVLAQASRERTIVHELAHAWVGDHLTAAERNEFVAGRRLRVWNDPDTAWNDRGTEHDAEIVRWALQEQCQTPARIGRGEHSGLAAAFAFLTGTEPLCDPDSDGLPILAPVSRRGGPQRSDREGAVDERGDQPDDGRSLRGGRSSATRRCHRPPRSSRSTRQLR